MEKKDIILTVALLALAYFIYDKFIKKSTNTPSTDSATAKSVLGFPLLSSSNPNATNTTSVNSTLQVKNITSVLSSQQQRLMKLGLIKGISTQNNPSIFDVKFFKL